MSSRSLYEKMLHDRRDLEILTHTHMSSISGRCRRRVSLLGRVPWQGSRKDVLLTGPQCGAQDATGKECGLHSGNVVASAAEQAQQEAVRDLWDSDSNVQKLSHDQLASLLDGQRDKSTVLVMYAPWCQYSQVCQLPSLLCFPPTRLLFAKAIYVPQGHPLHSRASMVTSSVLHATKCT